MKEFYPKVSIIIPVYNGEKYLKRAIDSALNQTYDNTEIIVVNDGSIDGTEEIIKSFGDKIKYYSKKNGGVSSALNLGINKMTGEYFSWLSHDDEYYPNKIEREVATLNLLEDKDTIIYSNYETINENGKVLSTLIHDHERLQKYPEIAILKGCINGLTLLIPKKAFEKCGVFNEKLQCTQDYDKWLDFIKKFRFYHIPDILTKTRIHSEQTTNTSAVMISEWVLLWKKIINAFPQKRIEGIFGNEENYYKEMLTMFELSPYEEMVEYCKNKLNIIINKKLKFKPLISVIIPVYNGSNYLEEAINSVIKQTYQNYEIIVVNDGSNDGGQTKDVALKFNDKIKYFEKINGGVASALNYGINKANGEYISWLSHDDIYNETKLQKQVEILNNLKDKKTIIFSNFELINEESIVFSKTNFHERFSKEQLENDILPVLKGTTNGCTMLIPKSVIEETGGFDESKKTTNDYIMWFKLFSKYPKAFIPDYLIKYRIHSEQDTKKNPVYISESEEMWSTVFKKIDNKYIRKLNYDPLVFYSEFYTQMKESELPKTAAILLEKYATEKKNENPIISIIMPCYNSYSYLEESINSILNQTFMPFELICVDDNSTDDTFKLLNELKKKDNRIKVLKNKFKKGVSGSMNTGITIAKGRYITRMDSDDISAPDRLKIQYEFLETNPQYGTCSTNIGLMDENGQIFSHNQYNVNNSPIEWQFLWLNPIPCAPCMYRKEILDGKRFNEDFSTAEDYEFLSHIVDKKIFFINKELYYYRIHSASLFQKNLIKTMFNSQLVSKYYYKKITGKESIPEYFELLTAYSTSQTTPEVADHYKILKFMEETLEHFKKYFSWNDEETENAKIFLQMVYDNFVINYYQKNQKKDLNLELEYQNMLNSLSWRVTKPLRVFSEIIRKTKSKVKKIIKRSKV